MTDRVPFAPRSVPTFYFVGVTTGQSSIMKVFPKWMDVIGLDVEIAGIDAPLHAPAETYRAIVEHIKTDPMVRGALVTTHKIDLLQATRDLFDYLDPNAQLADEISCIAKHSGRLEGFAKDPISSGKAWEAFVPSSHFGQTEAQVLCFGSGGAAVATSMYLASRPNQADRPHKFILVDINQGRLDHARAIHAQMHTDLPFAYVLNRAPVHNDALLSALPEGSVVVNATGMGKDIPGSPISDEAVFPMHGLVWEMNYRGELNFLRQARRQTEARQLRLEDGWVYFLHGWTQVIAEVFQIDLTAELFAELDRVAQPFR
ncbi:MAG: shikimate dehydrogenase [Anaerolineae bacterium]